MLVNLHLDATLRQYVLGELDEDARVELEERLVMEPDMFDLLGPTEDELTEEYLEDVLSPTERIGFERHFLTNEDRRWQLGFVRLLKDRASTLVSGDVEQPSVSLAAPIVRGRGHLATAGAADPMKGRAFGLLRLRPMWAGSLAATVAILLAGNVWFAYRGKNLGDELGRLRAEHQAEQREQQSLQVRVDRLSAEAQAFQTELESERQEVLQALQAELELERQQRKAIEGRASHEQIQATRSMGVPSAPLFVLATGLLRSQGSVMRIAVPADAQVIRLRLELPGDEYPLYRAVLYDAQAEEIWVQSKLTARASDGRAAVTVVLPSLLLSRGDYQLKLSGTERGREPEPIAAYSFRMTTP